MPVILDHGSEKMRRWLDPSRYEWSKELQDILKPFDGELEVYPVSKEVGKVGNNSPSFIIPIASKENKSNIANFFANAKGSKKSPQETSSPAKVKPEVEVKKELDGTPHTETKTVEEVAQHADDGGMANPTGIKRAAVDEPLGQTPAKKLSIPLSSSPTKTKTLSPSKLGRTKISATSNGTKSPAKNKRDGSQKITKFFANSS